MASISFDSARTSTQFSLDPKQTASAISLVKEKLQQLSAAPSAAPLIADRISVLATTLPAGMPEFVDFSNAESIKPYLANEMPLSTALAIAAPLYQSKQRGIGGTKFGVEFAMNPEILAYGMRLSKDEIVLEIAGASGQNAILLAMAGAKQVFMNDIDLTEVAEFEQLKKQISSEVHGNVGSRLESIEGTCFDILKKQPQLEGKVGLILCRNLIHFFNDLEQQIFIDLLKKLLKPGGKAIFTTNSVYTQKNSEIPIQNPTATTYSVTHCLIHDRSISLAPIGCIFKHYAAHHPAKPHDQNATAFIEFHLYNKDPIGTKGKWVVDNQAFNKIDADLRERIKGAVTENKSSFAHIKDGSVRVIINPNIRTYNIVTLPNLFISNGFGVEFVYALNHLGHLISSGNLFNRCNEMSQCTGQIGVIIQKPLN